MSSDPAELSKRFKDVWEDIGKNVMSTLKKVDEYLDTPFKFAYAFTDGLVGKYRKKYYFGPVRITKKAVGVQFSTPLTKVRIEIGRSKKGDWTFASKIGFGIHAFADLRLGGRIDTAGTFEPKATIRLFKRVKTVLSGGYNIKDKKTKPYGFKMRGPLYTHVTYNSKKGQTYGTCGALRNEKGEWETDEVRGFFKDMGLLLAGYFTRNRVFQNNQKSNVPKSKTKQSQSKTILSDDDVASDDDWEDLEDDEDNDMPDTISDSSYEIIDSLDDDNSSCSPWCAASKAVDFIKYCWSSNFSLGDENINDI